MIGNHKIKLEQFFFFTSYIVYIFFEILSVSFYEKYINSISKYVIFFCIVLLLLKEIIAKKMKKRDFIYLLICILMSFILLFRHDNGIDMLPLFLFLYSARNIEFKKIAKCTIILDLLLFFFVFISAKTGLIYDYIENGIRTRDYIGFRYSLFPQIIVFNITLLTIYLSNESPKRILIYLLLILLNYFTFKYTNSRLSFYQSIVLIIILLVFQKNNKLFYPKVLRFISIFSFIICGAISFYATYNFNYLDKNQLKLNEILGGRLYYGNLSLKKYKISLWGNDVEYVGNGLLDTGKKNNSKYNYVDNFYLNMSEKYGGVYFVVFILLFTFSIIYAYKKDDKLLILILTFIATHGLIDDLILYLYYNTFYFAISYSINDLNKYLDDRKRLKLEKKVTSI